MSTLSDTVARENRGTWEPVATARETEFSTTGIHSSPAARIFTSKMWRYQMSDFASVMMDAPFLVFIIMLQV